jgi:hypothetical protein
MPGVNLLKEIRVASFQAATKLKFFVFRRGAFRRPLLRLSLRQFFLRRDWLELKRQTARNRTK